MASYRNPKVRAVEIALRLVNERERHLRGIMKSRESTAEERLQALVDLARMTEMLVREMAEVELTKLSAMDHGITS